MATVRKTAIICTKRFEIFKSCFEMKQFLANLRLHSLKGKVCKYFAFKT